MYKTKFRQRLCRNRKILPRILRIIAGRLSAAGWTLGWVSAIDSQGQTIWIVDAHGQGKRFIMRADEMLTAFLELERAIHAFAVSLIL
jgi:hypothetical protein